MPRIQAHRRTRVALCPTSSSSSGFCTTAFIAIPVRVHRRNAHRPAVATTAITKVRTSSYWMKVPAISMRPFGRNDGTRRTSWAPKISSVPAWTTSRIPTTPAIWSGNAAPCSLRASNSRSSPTAGPTDAHGDERRDRPRQLELNVEHVERVGGESRQCAVPEVEYSRSLVGENEADGRQSVDRTGHQPDDDKRELYPLLLLGQDAQWSISTRAAGSSVESREIVHASQSTASREPAGHA